MKPKTYWSLSFLTHRHCRQSQWPVVGALGPWVRVGVEWLTTSLRSKEYGRGRQRWRRRSQNLPHTPSRSSWISWGLLPLLVSTHSRKEETFKIVHVEIRTRNWRKPSQISRHSKSTCSRTPYESHHGPCISHDKFSNDDYSISVTN